MCISYLRIQQIYIYLYTFYKQFHKGIFVMAQQPILYGLGTQAELKKKMLGKTVAKSHNLNGQKLTELMDTIQTGIQSFATAPNMAELASKLIKEILDKKQGPTWQCIIGEGFAYDISVQSDAFLLMFYNGNLGCLVFKT